MIFGAKIQTNFLTDFDETLHALHIKKKNDKNEDLKKKIISEFSFLFLAFQQYSSRDFRYNKLYSVGCVNST